MDRLPIEPLDKAKWERIERALEQRLEHEPPAPSPARRGWVPVAAIATAAAAAAIVTFALRDRTPPLAHRSPAPVSTVIETEDAPSHVALATSSLDVAPRSTARIEGDDESGVVVALEHGAVECEVAPRRGRPPFVVHAGDVAVRVVGTHFRVERDAAGTHVTVSRGVVEVEEHGKTTSVAAGASWPAPVETFASTAPPPPVIAPVVKTTPHVAGSASVVPPPSPRDRYDHALALEATQPDESLRIYRELGQGDGSWAMNALYAEARLELERGDKEAARDHFAEYVRRFPNGPNAADARDMYAKLK